MLSLLTKRQREALRMMRDENEEMVYECGSCMVGLEHFGPRTLFALLRLCAISRDSYSAHPGSGGMEIYSINETGRQLLKAAE